MTARETYLAHLEKSFAAQLANGGRNRAIEAHIAVLKKMPDEQFVEHRAKLDEMSYMAAPAVAAMAAAIMSKVK